MDSRPELRFAGGMQGRAVTVGEMEQLGVAAAGLLAPGSVIALVGGLGAGKTHWTKGLVAGLGSPAEVTSPTFGLVHEYHGGCMPVIHMDFHRLGSARELIALGWDEYVESGAVIVAEWADKFAELLPDHTLWLSFQIEPDGSRIIRAGRM